MNRFRVIFPSLVFLLGISVGPLSAQMGTATISGNVTDTTGAVVVGASVTTVNHATGFRRQTISSGQGQYNLPGLTPGSYSLSVEFKGFRRAELGNITVQVDHPGAPIPATLCYLKPYYLNPNISYFEQRSKGLL